MTLYQNSASNQRKTWILLAVFLAFLYGLGFFFGQVLDSPSLLVWVVIISSAMAFFSYWYSDKVVLAMSHARPIDHETNVQIYHLVENLCITAGLKMPRIYLIDDSAPNAFATGRNQDNAVIVLTTGIVAKLDKVELEGVIAHELSHIGNRDILLATIVTVLVGATVLLSDWMRRSLFFGRRRSNSDDNGQLGLILMIIAIVLSILAPLAASLMQLAISRKREFLADANAALLTRYPDGLIRALEKISADPEPLEEANRATANLYIASPFKSDSGQKTFWFTKMFLTHPPIEDRIAALKGIKI